MVLDGPRRIAGQYRSVQTRGLPTGVGRIQRTPVSKNLKVGQQYKREKHARRPNAEPFNTVHRFSNALVDKADAYDQALRANPAPVYAQLRLAHEALTKNLKNEEISFVEVMARIEAFAKEAKTVKDIVDEIRAVDDN